MTTNDDVQEQTWSNYINDDLIWPTGRSVIDGAVTLQELRDIKDLRVYLNGNHSISHEGSDRGGDPTSSVNSNKFPSTSSTTTVVHGSGRSRLNVKAISKNAHLEDLIQLERPELTPDDLTTALDLSDLISTGDVAKHYSDYENEIIDKVYLGEGGRELIRAALKKTGYGGGYKGGYKGANNMKLVTLAYEAGLWALVQRCKIERLTENISEVHLRFVKFMSDKKKFERQKWLAASKKQVTKARTPDEFLKYYLLYGCLPPKFVLSDVGRNVLRRNIRQSRAQNSHVVDLLCKRQGISFKKLKNWNNTTLMYFMELLGQDEITKFCIDWASGLDEQTSTNDGKREFDELHQKIISRNCTDMMYSDDDLDEALLHRAAIKSSTAGNLNVDESEDSLSIVPGRRVSGIGISNQHFHSNTNTNNNTTRKGLLGPLNLKNNILEESSNKRELNIIKNNNLLGPLDINDLREDRTILVEGERDCTMNTVNTNHQCIHSIKDDENDEDLSEEIFEVDDIDNINEDWLYGREIHQE